jgi:hypothetical protein
MIISAAEARVILKNGRATLRRRVVALDGADGRTMPDTEDAPAVPVLPYPRVLRDAEARPDLCGSVAEADATGRRARGRGVAAVEPFVDPLTG